MAKQKATHQGTCQCCGHFQKLPGGKLSKHGYTKKWGFFSGTCRGADELPFEQSCDLVKSFIENAKEQIKLNEEKIANLESSTSENTWMYRYKSGREKGNMGKSGYYWEEVKVSNMTVTFSDGTSADARRYAGLGYNDAEVIKSLNTSRAKHHKVLIKQLNEYIAWQEARIKEWAPKELTEIKG